VCEDASARVYDAADASFGQTWPFALVELPASFALTTAADHHLFTDGASYEIPNFPVLELARWLAASSKGAYFNLNVRGQYWTSAVAAAVTRAIDAPAWMKFSSP